MWRSFVAVFRKEFLHIRRDRGDAACIALMIPLFQLMLFGFIDQTVHDVPTVVVDQDRSARQPRAHRPAARHRTPSRSRTSPPNPHDARERDHRRARARRRRDPARLPRQARARQRPRKVLVLIDGSDSTVSAQALARSTAWSRTMNLEALATRRRARPSAARRAADHPVQPRRAHRELHHPRASSRSCCRSSRSCSPRSPSCASARRARSSSSWSRRSIRSA